MKWACWMTAVGIWSGKDLFMLSWTVEVRLTVSTGSSLEVLLGLVGAIDPALDDDGISEWGEPTTFAPINSAPDDDVDAGVDVDAGLDLLTILSEWIKPRLINICTWMHIFLALSCFPLATIVLQSLEQHLKESSWTFTWQYPAGLFAVLAQIHQTQ